MTARGFRSIIGEYEAKRHFQAAIASGRVAHAYLITGDAGSGKTMLAEAFAETLVCETRQARASPVFPAGRPSTAITRTS